MMLMRIIMIMIRIMIRIRIRIRIIMIMIMIMITIMIPVWFADRPWNKTDTCTPLSVHGSKLWREIKVVQ